MTDTLSPNFNMNNYRGPDNDAREVPREIAEAAIRKYLEPTMPRGNYGPEPPMTGCTLRSGVAGGLGQAIPTPATPIEQLLAAQQSISGAIMRCIENLEARLQPVCSPPSPRNEAKDPGIETPGLSGLAQMLHQHNRVLDQIHGRLAGLTERLEV